MNRRILQYDPNDPPVCPCLFPFSHSERIKRVHVRIYYTDISRFLKINEMERNIVRLYGEQALVYKFLQDERELEQALRSSIAAQNEIPSEFFGPDQYDEVVRDISLLRQEILNRLNDEDDSDQTDSDDDVVNDATDSDRFPPQNWGGGYGENLAENVDAATTALEELTVGLFESDTESTDEVDAESDNE